MTTPDHEPAAGTGEAAEPLNIKLVNGWYFEQVNPPHGMLYALRSPKGQRFGPHGNGMIMNRAQAEYFAKGLAKSDPTAPAAPAPVGGLQEAYPGPVGANPSGVYSIKDLHAAYRKGWTDRARLAQPAPAAAASDDGDAPTFSAALEAAIDAAHKATWEAAEQPSDDADAPSTRSLLHASTQAGRDLRRAIRAEIDAAPGRVDAGAVREAAKAYKAAVERRDLELLAAHQVRMAVGVDDEDDRAAAEAAYNETGQRMCEAVDEAGAALDAALASTGPDGEGCTKVSALTKHEVLTGLAHLQTALNDPDTDNWVKLRICDGVQALVAILASAPLDGSAT